MEFFAYLDPGTGSVIIQALVGVFAGAAIFGRQFMTNVAHKVRTLFSKSDNSKK